MELRYQIRRIYAREIERAYAVTHWFIPSESETAKTENKAAGNSIQIFHIGDRDVTI